MADGTLIDQLYYELAYRTEGMGAGEARARASLKAIEDAAAHTRSVLATTVPESLLKALADTQKNAEAAVAASVESAAANERSAASAKTAAQATTSQAASTESALGTVAAAQAEVASTASAVAESAKIEAASVAETGIAAKEAAIGYATLGEAQRAWVAETKNLPGTGATLHGPLAPGDVNVATMAADAKKSGRKVADELLSGVKEQFAARVIEIEQQVQAGLLTAEQAVIHRRQNAAARNTSILDVVDKAATSGVLDGAKGGEVLTALAGNLKNVEQASTRAGTGLTGLRRPLTSLADSAVGVNRSVGQVAGSLLSFATGNAVAIGVTAGIAAIAFAYDKITEGARKAAEQIAKVTAELLKQSDVRLKTDVQRAQETLKGANQNLADKKAAVDSFAAAGLQGTGGLGVVGRTIAGVNQFFTGKQASKDLAEAQTALAQAHEGVTRAVRDQTTSYVENLSATARNGALTKDQINQLRIASEQAKTALAAFNAETPEAAQARVRFQEDHRGDPNALASYQQQLKDQAYAHDSYIEDLNKGDSKREKAAEKAAAAAKKLFDAQKAALGGFDSAIAGLTPGSGDNLTLQIAKLVKAAQDAKLGTDVITEKVRELRAAAAEKLQGEGDKLARDLTKQLVSETGSQAQQLREGLKDFNASIATDRAKGLTVDPALVDRLRAAKVEAIALADQSERLQVLYQGIDDDLRLGGNLIRDMANVNTDLVQAEADKASAQARYNAGDKTAYRDIQNAQGRINSLLGEQNKLQDANKKHLTEADARQHTLLDTITSVSGGIANAANAAFGLASALGGANSTAAKLFGSIGQVSGGINAASGLAKTAGFGKLLSSASGIASLAGPVGQVIGGAIAIGTTLFGGDPKIAAARDETNKAMTGLRDALLTLKDAYLQSVSSADIAKDTTLAKQAAALGANGTVNGRRILADGEGGGAGRRGNLRDIASALGLNFDDGTLLQRMKELDMRYGTDLATFVTNQAPAGLLKALQTLPDALKSATGNLGAFSGKPADIIASVAYQFDLLGKTDAAEKVRETVQALEAAGKNLGEFKTQLDKLTDPNLSPAERQSILDSVAQRLGTGSNLNLGDFTGDQIRQLFSDASKAGTASAAKGTGGFNVDRSVTEVTGSRLAALFSTGNIIAERNMIANEAALAYLTSGKVPVIMPPVMPASAFASQAAPVIFNITIAGSTFTVVAPPNADGAAFGAQTADGYATTISRQIQEQIAWKQRSQGEMPS